MKSIILSFVFAAMTSTTISTTTVTTSNLWTSPVFKATSNASASFNSWTNATTGQGPSQPATNPSTGQGPSQPATNPSTGQGPSQPATTSRLTSQSGNNSTTKAPGSVPNGATNHPVFAGPIIFSLLLAWIHS